MGILTSLVLCATLQFVFSSHESSTTENPNPNTNAPSDIDDNIGGIQNYLGVSCEPGHRCVAVLECLPCDYGSYKDDGGSGLCEYCPPGCTTLRKGATNWKECIPKCPEGYEETDNCGTCTKCRPGYYKSSWKNVPCTPCTNSDYDPALVGMVSEMDCHSTASTTRSTSPSSSSESEDDDIISTVDPYTANTTSGTTITPTSDQVTGSSSESTSASTSDSASTSQESTTDSATTSESTTTTPEETSTTPTTTKETTTTTTTTAETTTTTTTTEGTTTTTTAPTTSHSSLVEGFVSFTPLGSLSTVQWTSITANDINNDLGYAYYGLGWQKDLYLRSGTATNVNFQDVTTWESGSTVFMYFVARYQWTYSHVGFPYRLTEDAVAEINTNYWGIEANVSQYVTVSSASISHRYYLGASNAPPDACLSTGCSELEFTGVQCGAGYCMCQPDVAWQSTPCAAGTVFDNALGTCNHWNQAICPT